MSRRRWLLNLALVAACAYCGKELIQRWQAAEERRRAILAAPSAPAAWNVEPPAETPPLRAASYFEVAEKMLFSRDRNPAVVIDVVAERPMPPLPLAYGVMDLGEGPVALLAMKGEAQRGYRLGEVIGEFKLVAASPAGLTFEWEGRRVSRRLEELRPDVKEIDASTAGAPPPRAAAPTAPSTTSISTTEAGPKFGADLSADSKYCAPDDDSPEGTVVEGFRKVLRRTPFSTTCTWERVR